MEEDKARNVLLRLGTYDRLKRKATDEIGWIAFGLGVSRKLAEQLIKDARALKEKKPDIDKR